MRRGDRLFEIIQLLRVARNPQTAAQIALALEVNVRTIYRDIAALQARRVPIEGAPGLGYVLRRGFDLPPLMFTPEEIEAIAVGARLVRRTGDVGLQRGAESVLSKMQAVLPRDLRDHMIGAPFVVSDFGARPADASRIRQAMRERRKLRIGYVDERGRSTSRIILPIAVAYLVEATLVAAWCELRGDFRHFRTDRIIDFAVLDDSFDDSEQLLKRWLAQRASQASHRAAAVSRPGT
jgi:predicted DNA-binding transcriptional regulator YafY